MSRWGTDREDYDVNATLEKMKKQETPRMRVKAEPAREPRPINDEARRPDRIKHRIRVLTIKGFSTDEIWERVNRIAKVSKILVSAIRNDTRATMKVLDELGHLKNATLEKREIGRRNAD